MKPKQEARKIWTEQELETLRQLASKHTAVEIGRILGRSRGAVMHQAVRSKIRLTSGRNPGHFTGIPVTKPDKPPTIHRAKLKETLTQPESRPKRVFVSRLNWCKCGAPYTNLRAHKERTGCRL